MTKVQIKFMKKVIWVTIIAFCLRCLCSGTKIISHFSLYDLYGYIGESIAFSTFLMLIYEKFIWKYNPLEETPILKKKYYVMKRVFHKYFIIRKHYFYN